MADTSTRARQRADDTFSAMNDGERHQRDAMRDVKDAVAEAGETVTEKLKAVGVDTEVMATTAKEQVSELQRLVSDEMRVHPMRTLGIAAAVGLFVGLLTAR